VPIYNGKSTAGHECCANGARQSRLVRDAVKSVGQENKIDRMRYQACQFIGIAFDKFAVRERVLRKTEAGLVEQLPVDVDRDDALRQLRNLQRKSAVAAAHVDDIHPGTYVDCGQHLRRIGPQRLPPAGVRHFGTLKKAGNPLAPDHLARRGGTIWSA
jgi:hypothetical protein